MAKSAAPPAAVVRCAIYTRKSSEEGLEQDFNSLHAQREACEAYVRSQVGEGWRLLPALYDDGGYSGGNIERPGLKQLLADIDRGLVDIVVVYKVDRLTRSLSDFAKIVDRFDANGASFVSVTQSFNTTTSMGRLTLNMLLSFAQFEREVTGERIRDKLAASKRKGMWMGGNLPLGYDASGRTLIINELEAEQVRHIFRRYLDLKSVHRLKDDLQSDGYRSKRRQTLAGDWIGGVVMSRGALFHMLSNRLYVGQIVHKGECHPGQHPPILDPELFEQVQNLLDQNRGELRPPSLRRTSSPLVGKMFDPVGRPMSPTISYGRAGKRFRYYVSTSLQIGTRAQPGDGTMRLAGPETEAFVLRQLDRLFGATDHGQPFDAVVRVDVAEDSVSLTLNAGDRRGAEAALRTMSRVLLEGEQAWEEGDGKLVVQLPVRLKIRGGRAWCAQAQGARIAAKPDLTLIKGLKRAHQIARAAGMSPLCTPDEQRQATLPRSDYERRLIGLVFLPPDTQKAILEGRQPLGMNLEALSRGATPLLWQR